ncbi:MAG: glutamate--tRNA ligase [Rhodobacteraceae bacterium]|nr:glutamate--tRNA ligase [Paracoccaceae bacterium]
MTVTRFAPSPTGYLHIGNMRAALMNYLIARKTKGIFILRIDDTDPERSKEEYVDQIKRDLEWLGLTWDRLEHQSERLDRYHAAADKLRDMGRFYECFETPTELDLKRKKQLNMGKPPVYDRAAWGLSDAEKDALRAERGSGVLIRADGQFLYTLASVVDDTEMGITHVVRGSDHVTNTATQIQMIQALGGNVPEFAHHSLLTGSQGEALSKRLGTLALKDMRENGIEPEAIISHMARLGSSEPVELRTSLDEVANNFELSTFGSAPTKFDEADLYPLTARLLHELPFADIQADLDAAGVSADLAEAFWAVVRENITTRKDIVAWWTLISQGADPLIDEEDREFVATAIDMLPALPFDDGTWFSWTEEVKAATGRKGKGLFMPLRKALTGMAHGPDMSALMPLLQVVKAQN